MARAGLTSTLNATIPTDITFYCVWCGNIPLANSNAIRNSLSWPVVTVAVTTYGVSMDLWIDTHRQQFDGKNNQFDTTLHTDPCWIKVKQILHDGVHINSNEAIKLDEALLITYTSRHTPCKHAWLISQNSQLARVVRSGNGAYDIYICAVLETHWMNVSLLIILLKIISNNNKSSFVQIITWHLYKPLPAGPVCLTWWRGHTTWPLYVGPFFGNSILNEFDFFCYHIYLNNVRWYVLLSNYFDVFDFIFPFELSSSWVNSNRRRPKFFNYIYPIGNSAGHQRLLLRCSVDYRQTSNIILTIWGNLHWTAFSYRHLDSLLFDYECTNSCTPMKI